MGGTDVQSAAPVRVGPRAGVRGQPKSPGKAPPGAETSPGRLARASAKLEWKHARPANASPRHRPAPRKIPPLPEVRLLHSFQSPFFHSPQVLNSSVSFSPSAMRSRMVFASVAILHIIAADGPAMQSSPASKLLSALFPLPLIATIDRREDTDIQLQNVDRWYWIQNSAVRGKSRHRTVSLDRSMSYGLFCPGTI